MAVQHYVSNHETHASGIVSRLSEKVSELFYAAFERIEKARDEAWYERSISGLNAHQRRDIGAREPDKDQFTFSREHFMLMHRR